ncbi:hypothetical protein KR009_002585, partial [Drosophila setifemur]
SFIDGHGYPVERHEVVTPDGYILELYRIPYSPHSPPIAGRSRPVFYLLHGLLMNSDCWVISDPSQGLAYLLADAGYDVWLGNARGTKYSRRHLQLKPSKKQFWQFSWHEMGIYDLPSSIDFVLKQTNQQAVHFVGHSQGCTTFLVMLSERPEYGEKILTSHLLAPVAFQGHMTSLLVRTLMPMVLLLPDMEVRGSHPIVKAALSYACAHSTIREVCKGLIFAVAGSKSSHMNNTLVPIIMAISPDSCSSRQLRHFLHNIISGRFAKFDFGPKLNKQMYGRQTPPDYPLQKVMPREPIDLYYTENDILLGVEDVHQLMGVLPKFRPHLMPDRDWNHADFLFATTIKEQINDLIIRTANGK